MPGDIIFIKKGQAVPCDIFIIKSLIDNQQIYIKTEQLDGENDWKSKQSLAEVEELYSGNKLKGTKGQFL